VEFEWETRVILRADAVQATLGSNGRLGYNTWLGLQPQPVRVAIWCIAQSGNPSVYRIIVNGN
jgi:predicted component of type VI protein secretion system